MSQTSYPALLLMESHGLAPNVRSASFASVKVWSKLYQAGPYFLDLTLAPHERNLGLRGEILTNDDTPVPASAQVRLVDHNGEAAVTTLMDGNFVFVTNDTGHYRLEIMSDQARLTVENLTVG